MSKIDSNYESLNNNQSDLSRRLENLEKTHELRASAMEQRLNAMENSLKRYEMCENKICSMADLVDTRMKEIHDANRQFEGMFKEVAQEMAVIKSSPNHNLAGEMEELRRLVNQVDQNSRNIHLVLTGLAQEFQSIQGVVQFVRNQLKVNLQPGEIASVSSIGLSKQGQTLTKVTFYSVDS